MKFLLYTFATLWFVAGMALLLLVGIGLWSGWFSMPAAIPRQPLSSVGSGEGLFALAIVGLWLWTFLFPALLAGALAALLGRFDRLQQTLGGVDAGLEADDHLHRQGPGNQADERATPDVTPARPARTKREPYIGTDREDLGPKLKQFHVPPQVR